MDQSDGEITVTAAGGTGVLNYTIVQLPGNLTGSGSGVFTGVAAGTYTVRVTDVNGCNIITAPGYNSQSCCNNSNRSVTSNYNGRHVSCNGSSDGEITITSAGGTDINICS